MSTVLGAVAVGAVIALVAAGQPRLTFGMVGEEVNGADTPAAAALALVALAGAAAALLMRMRARRVVGAVLLVVSLSIVVAFLAPADSATYSVYAIPGEDLLARRSVWVWLGSAGGVLAMVGSAAITARAGRWPEPRRRYESSTRRRARTGDAWDAIDRGEDPTT
jgi:hypothetical protein